MTHNLWYSAGANHAPDPRIDRIAAACGPASLRAYSVGVIARLFGVDLSAAITS